MKRLVSLVVMICVLAPALLTEQFLALGASDLPTSFDVAYHSTVYYDASNPYRNVYGDIKYAYQCYVSVEDKHGGQAAVFEKDGSIITDRKVNENLVTMFYAQNFKATPALSGHMDSCDFIIDFADQLKAHQIVDDIASAAAESLGGLAATYLTGGAMSLSKIAESVAVQTIENLTSHFVDVSTIISEAQLNLCFANASRLKILREKLNESWDLRTFSACEKYTMYAEETEKLCNATMELVPFLTEGLTTNALEKILEYLGDMAKGFVGVFGEAIEDASKIKDLQKNKPEVIASAIQLAHELSNLSEELSMDILIEKSELLSDSLRGLFVLVQVRDKYVNWPTGFSVCQLYNQVLLHVEEDKPPELPNGTEITIPDGYYTFENGASGLMINVYEGIDADETNVVTWKNDGTVDQKFYVKHTGNGKYIIYAVCSADGTGGYTRCLDVYTGGTNVLPAPGHNIDIYKRDKMWDACQLFYIVPQGNGTYAIEVCAVENLVIGAASPDNNNGNIEVERWNGHNSQTWYLRETTVDGEQGDAPANGKYNASQYVGNATIQERLQSIFAAYPPGESFFTKNGKACSCHNNSDCVAAVAPCNCLRKVTVDGKKVDLYGSQCIGFVRYCQQMLFGGNEWSNEKMFKKITSGSSATADGVKKWFTDNKASLHTGAHIRVWGQGHSVCLLDVDYDKGVVYLLECNWTSKKSEWCMVNSIRAYTWKQFAATYTSVNYAWVLKDYASLYPEEEASKLSVQYDANGGTIPEAVVIGHRYKVTHDQGVNFRPEPSVESGVITSLKKGTTFEVAINDTKKDNNYTWGKTTINGQVGWVVISDFVTKTTEIRNTDYYIQGSVINRIDTGKPHVQEMTQGVLADFYNNTTFRLEREGYLFLGWSLQAEGGEVISHDLAFLPESICPDLLHGDLTITVYAQWEAVVCEHVWDEGSVTTAASCEENGIRTYSCTRCSEKRTDIIPATGHSVDRDGSCSLCGKQIVELSTMKIRVENATVSAGNTVTVAVLVEQNEGFTYLKLGLEYDDALELVSVSNGTLIDSLTQGKYYVWSASDNQVADGVLAYLTFRAKENAEDGNYTVGVHCLECSNEDEIDVSVIGTAGCITVKSYQYGDANGDQKIDGKDATRLRKYLANYDENTGTCDVEIAEGADVNGDGVVNGKDLTRLLRYLANFDDATGESTIPLGPSN